MEPEKKRRFSTPPLVHKEFDALENKLRKLRVRVIQYRHDQIGLSEPMLDIRQFHVNKINPDGTPYTGFSPNGVSLTREDLQKLFDLIPEAIEEIEKIT